MYNVNTNTKFNQRFGILYVLKNKEICAKNSKICGKIITIGLCIKCTKKP